MSRYNNNYKYYTIRFLFAYLSLFLFFINTSTSNNKSTVPTTMVVMAHLSSSSIESGLTLAIAKRNVLSTITNPRKYFSWDEQLTQIFYEADFNRDGYISFEECYERVLRFYIKLNQQAPIPPPDRNIVKQIYNECDYNQNQRLSITEFKVLAQILIGKAYTRLLVHKLVTILIGPFVATSLVHILATESILEPIRKEFVILINDTLHIPTALASVLLSTHFWKTVVLIFTISHLGNAVLHIVNYLLYNNTKRAAKYSKRGNVSSPLLPV